MKTILENIPYDPDRDPRTVQVREPGKKEETTMPRFPLPVLARATIVGAHNIERHIPVNALLDTGSDITIVNPSIIDRLDNELGSEGPVQISKRIEFFNRLSLQPFQRAYKLNLVLGGHMYSSIFGFTAPQNFPFEDMDVWVGQDILQQLVVTFNGPEKRITVMDPNLT